MADDELYVRGYNGQQSRWYPAAIRQKAGRIRAAGTTKALNRSALRWTRHATLATVLIAAQPWLNAAVSDTAQAASPAFTHAQPTRTMKIRIDVNGTEVVASLEDNATSRDFISLLPLTLTLEDYNGTEKIAYLPKKLSTKDAPAGIDPSIGDITYYAPWGNLAIFYKDFGYSRGLVRLGRMDSIVNTFDRSGTLRVTIDRMRE